MSPSWFCKGQYDWCGKKNDREAKLYIKQEKEGRRCEEGIIPKKGLSIM